MKDAVCKICLLAHLNSLGQPSNIKCNFPHHFLLQTSFSPSKVMKLQAFKQNIWNKNHFIRMRMQHQPPTPISSKPKWGVFIALKTIHRRRIPPTPATPYWRVCGKKHFNFQQAEHEWQLSTYFFLPCLWISRKLL